MKLRGLVSAPPARVRLELCCAEITITATGCACAGAQDSFLSYVSGCSTECTFDIRLPSGTVFGMMCTGVVFGLGETCYDSESLDAQHCPESTCERVKGYDDVRRSILPGAMTRHCRREGVPNATT